MQGSQCKHSFKKAVSSTEETRTDVKIRDSYAIMPTKYAGRACHTASSTKTLELVTAKTQSKTVRSRLHSDRNDTLKK